MSDDKKPDIRFKDYSDDWEQRKMGDTSEKVCVGFVGTCEKYYTDETGIPMYRTGNLNGLSLNKDDMKYVTRDFHQQNKKSQLKFGDILIARHGDSGKAVNYESSEEANCLNIVIIRPDFKKCNYRFLTDCINSPRCQKHIKSLSAGSTQAVINTSEIEKLEVLLPESIDEQEKIAAYFENLDHLITLHQRKYDKLQNLKKAMLEKMFPKNGCNVPEIRFKGFTDAWEQRKVSGIGNIVTGSTPKTSVSDNYGGEFLFVSPADIQENRYVDETITTLTKKGFDQGRKIREKASLFVSIGSTIGKVAQINQESTTNQQINAVEPYDNFDDDFIFTSLENISGSIKAIASNQAVPIVNKTTFGETEIQVPLELGEQQKIGQYFVNLDHLITLHQRELEKLKNIKKAMLEKMFV